MPSLRTLLDVPDFDSLGLDTGTSPAWQRQLVESLYFTNYCGATTYDNSTDYSMDCICQFCVPSSANIITFELWGGGGGGAGSRCCAWGPPGGAGAHAQFVADNSGGDYTGCYRICLASATCCVDSDNGTNGCCTTLDGEGICMCVQGGRPGCSICQFFNCFPNNGCGVLEHPNSNDCACFYGPAGTTGVPGKHGFLQTDVCCPSDFCYYKVGIPIPGGFGRQEVAYQMVRAYCNTGSLNTNCRATGWVVAGSAGYGHIYAGIGTGGETARVCGGGCCCGSPGGPGLVKVSWT